MDIKSKQQYMETLRARYLKSDKREKGEILDEYFAFVSGAGIEPAISTL